MAPTMHGRRLARKQAFNALAVGPPSWPPGEATASTTMAAPAPPQAGPLLAEKVCGTYTTFPPMWPASDQHDAGNHGLHQEILF